MEFKATLKNLRISARKVRLVADAVRGKSVPAALTVLEELDKRSATPVAKLIKSAAANAAHTEGTLKSQLKVGQILVNEGPTLRRFRPRAFGRAFTIRKRTSHVIVVLEQTDAAAKRSTKQAAASSSEKKAETKKAESKPASKPAAKKSTTKKTTSSTKKTSTRTAKKSSSTEKKSTKTTKSSK